MKTNMNDTLKETSMVQELLDRLTENLNGSRIEVVTDVVTGKPIVALALDNTLDAHTTAMMIRCLTAFGRLPEGVECKPCPTTPALINIDHNTAAINVRTEANKHLSKRFGGGGVFGGCKQEDMG
jgi:hypothetical protein